MQTKAHQRKPYSLIASQSALERAVRALADAPVLYVDTEFLRENTYYPEFALLQVYDGSHAWLFDPLECPDLGPVWELLLRKEVLKVFHAARQDIEIIYRESGSLPLPLFDTQVAASLLGYGLQSGFGNLVQRITKHTLSKAQSFTDWMRRPLSEKQLAYAADDVIWLMPVHRHLDRELERRGRKAWLAEEQARLVDVNSYEDPPEEAFWRVKGVNRLKGRDLAVLRELAAWRERTAQRLNLPRRRVIGDEPMVEIARCTSLDAGRLERVRGLSPGAVRRFGHELIEAWRKGANLEPGQWPKKEASPSHSPGTEMRLELLDTLVRLKAEASDIAPSILASRQELARLASWGRRRKGTPPELACLEGWRRELVGNDLLALLEGRICLHLNPETGRPVIRPVPWPA